MRDYQPKNKNPYYIDKEIYKSILYIIRSYNSQVNEYNNLIEEKAFPKFNIERKGNNKVIHDITSEIALKLEGKANLISAIDKAIKTFKETESEKYYFKGIWNNILYNTPYPLDAAKSTYSYHKARFIWLVGKNLNII